MVKRNFLCSLGEIDLIFKDKEEIVFVEVRYRKSIHYGSAAESVSFSKQQKLIRTAWYYLQASKLNIDNISCRFDVMDISPVQSGGLKIQWIKDAFQVLD